MKKLLVTLLTLTLLLASCGGETTVTSSIDDTTSTEITSSVEDTSSEQASFENETSSASTSSLQEISSTETTSSEENNVAHIGKKVFSDNFENLNLWVESQDIYSFEGIEVDAGTLGKVTFKEQRDCITLKTKEEYRVGKNFTFEISYTASASEDTNPYILFILGTYTIQICDEKGKISLNFNEEEVGVYTDKENPFEFNKITLNVKDGVATLYADNEQIITAEVANGSLFSKIQLIYPAYNADVSFDSVNIFSE